MRQSLLGTQNNMLRAIWRRVSPLLKSTLFGNCILFFYLTQGRSQIRPHPTHVKRIFFAEEANTDSMM